MKVFVQLEIGSWQRAAFDKPWLHFASSSSDDIVGTDLDNHSDSVVVDMVLRLISQAEKVFILILAHETDSLGAGARILDYLLSHPEQIGRVVMFGDHSDVEEKAGKLTGRFVKTDQDDVIKDLIRAFAQ